MSTHGWGPLGNGPQIPVLLNWRSGPPAPESVVVLMCRLTEVDLTRCPVCHAGHLRLVAVFRPGQFPAPVLDTS